jgi:hypothetical protein
VKEQQGKHFCACGCGKPITIRKRHRRCGIPRYLHEHVPHPAPPGEGPAHHLYKLDRTLLKGRGPHNFTCATKKKIFTRDGGRCVRCGSERDLQHDHVVPVWQGGGAELANGQLLCKLCHGLKSLYEQAVRDGDADEARIAECIRAFVHHTFGEAKS